MNVFFLLKWSSTNSFLGKYTPNNVIISSKTTESVYYGCGNENEIKDLSCVKMFEIIKSVSVNV